APARHRSRCCRSRISAARAGSGSGSAPPDRSTTMQTLLQLAVRWADLDVNGHVRHSVYYDFGAQARIVALEAVGLGLRWMAANQIGPVLFREQASFRREVRMGDELTIDTQLAGLSADSRKWRIAHHIRRGEELCASLD